MGVFITLTRRELAGYFLSLTGYVVMATILFLLGLSFTDVISKLNASPTDAPLTEVFYVTVYFWLILLLTAPVITMRTFSLEKFSGTYETLLTAPVRDWEVVLAKFAGAFIFYLITWVPLVGYLLATQHYTNDQGTALDWGTLASTIVGIVLIGGFYMSMGCFASSLTQSQMIAAIVSYGMGFVFFLISLRPMYAGNNQKWEDRLFSHMSMTEHMLEFARGNIDSRHLVYYASMIVLFLFLTARVVESRRWK
jgi:ABC-2 type transport system permease protein